MLKKNNLKINSVLNLNDNFKIQKNLILFQNYKKETNKLQSLILSKLLIKQNKTENIYKNLTNIYHCNADNFFNFKENAIEIKLNDNNINKNTTNTFYQYIKTKQLILSEQNNLNCFVFNFFKTRKKKLLLLQNLHIKKIKNIYLNILKKNNSFVLNKLTKNQRSYAVLKSIFKRYQGILKVRKRKLRRRLIRKLKNTVKRWQLLQDRIFLRKKTQQVAPRMIQETKRRTVILHHLGTKRNLKLTATTLQGQVLLYFSCGTKQFKKARRRSGLARLQAMNKMLINLKKLKIKRVILLYNRGRFPKIRSVRRALRRKRIRVIKYIFKSPKPHNGCRNKKIKRK